MSEYDDALREARRLADCLRARGVAVSIELQPGVSTSGWLDSRKVGVLAHHTVSRRSMGLTPILSLVKRGRPDVPGPLCNGYGGFDEVYRIITMGWANHPGLGGPLALAGVVIPRDNGRPYLWGTEFEGGLDPADFTPSYRSFMARAHLAVLDYLGRPVEAHGEHKTWAPSRKIDRLGYTTESGRDELRRAAAAPGPSPAPAPTHEEQYVMATREEVRADLTDIVRSELSVQLAGLMRPRGVRLKGTHLFWADFGTFRRPWSAGMQASHPIVAADVEVTDPVWRLPIVAGPGGEAYRKRGGEAAWFGTRDEAGNFARTWPKRDGWLAAGAPPILDLDPSHPFWSLPVVGTLPPEDGGPQLEEA